MNERLDIQEITKELLRAFKPYKCIAEESDYKNAIRFSVLNESGTLMIIEPMIVSLSEVQDESKLSFFMEQQKEIIRGKGYSIR